MTSALHSPKVSIFIPAYNTERYIADTIGSIVNQTYQDWELIIVDDCSTDDTLSVCNSYAEKDTRIKLYANEKNLGMMENWIYGVSLCNGKYWGKLDSDDWWHPDMLKECVAILDNHEDVGLVVSRFIEIDENNNAIEDSEYFFPNEWKNKAISYVPFVLGDPFSMFQNPRQGIGLLRQKIFGELGNFTTHPAGDTEMWFRIGAHYKVYCLDKVFHKHRIWSNSFTRTEVLQQNKRDKNLYEVQVMIYRYYLDHNFLDKQEIKENLKLITWKYNFSLAGQLRLAEKFNKTFLLWLKNFMMYPKGTLMHFFHRSISKIFTRF
jgi:glycosyltransferase involved in cell wall biosynthesis